MKLILSRKGFDSGSGGGPSPILPDGSLLSLPIPSDDALHYRDVAVNDQPLSRLMRKLGIAERIVRGKCHLDPDLESEARPRSRGWHPAFGSVGAAGSHLISHGVGAGDLFVFFGYFRQTIWRRRRLQWSGPHLHIIFGYLEVGQVFDPTKSVPDWLTDHPHCGARLLDQPGNRVYIAAERASGPLAGCPGAQSLRYSKRRVLTADGMSRSRWHLPRAVFGDRDISFHSPDSWRDGYFQSAARGQEFVMDASAAVLNWARGVLLDADDHGDQSSS